MTGLAMMLKSFGIKIEPAEVENAFNQAKDALPKLLEAFNKLNERQERIENLLIEMKASIEALPFVKE